jgi:putative salt-induced outer membrane protein YdiY
MKPTPSRPRLSASPARAALGLLALVAAQGASAQDWLPRDGQVRATLGLSASLADGNTRARHIVLVGEAVRATELDRTTLSAMSQYASNDGTTTADRIRLGARQDREIGRQMFGFGSLDLERNRFVDLSLRTQLGGGIGRHLVRAADVGWDVFGGLAYTDERYRVTMVVDGGPRDAYGYVGLLLGQASVHRLGEGTIARQRLTLVPNLRNGGEFRANWDLGLAVALNASLSLNVGLAYAYNSDPGLGRKTTDTLLATGVSVRLE